MTTSHVPAPSAAPNPQATRFARTAGGRVRETLARVLDDLRMLVPVDGSAFLLVDAESQTVEPGALWFPSPELRRAFAEPPEPREGGGGLRRLAELALSRDRPLLLPRLEDWEAGQSLQDALTDALGPVQAERFWDTFRRASLVACPIKSATGRPLAVLVAASLAWPPLGPEELRAVEALADVSALALERAELLEAEGARSRRELQLSRAAEDISASLEPDEVYRRVTEHATRLTGARKASLARLNARETELRVVASIDFSSEFAERRFPVGHGMMGEVARTRRPYLSEPAESGRWDAAVVAGEGVASFVHVPIELGPRVFGVLTVADDRPAQLGQEAVDVLLKLGRSSAAAIANAMDFERERRVARALTTGFVPESLPDIAGHDVGLMYAPAAKETVGGDVYGVWRLPGGELAVLVGDVAGKGVETAALSAMVRFFVEARTWDTPCPATVLGQANRMLMARLPRDTFVTAFLALLTPGSLRYANAGHLPPLLVRGEGVEPLRAGGLPLGVHAEATPTEDKLSLGQGDLLFAYSDGLIEARSGTEMYGAERLSELVARLAGDLSPQQLTDAVYDEVCAWADGLSDDAVALALRPHSG